MSLIGRKIPPTALRQPANEAAQLLEAFIGVPDTPENRAKFIATIPMGRMARPDDIAKACLYLAFDEEAEFFTGVILPIDGANGLANERNIRDSGKDGIARSVHARREGMISKSVIR